jgi:hypothetical protein
MHDREVFLEIAKQGKRNGAERCARTAVKDEEDGVGSILSPHRNPLCDATDFDEAALVDSVWRRDFGSSFVRPLKSEADEKGERESGGCGKEDSFHGSRRNSSESRLASGFACRFYEGATQSALAENTMFRIPSWSKKSRASSRCSPIRRMTAWERWFVVVVKL